MVCRVGAMWRWGEDLACRALLLLTVLLADMVTPDHYVNQCHQNYYNWPRCVDHPDGYGCECGPGFYWNTHMCVALGIDSRLEFSSVMPVQYTLLMSKPFPELTSFTIGLWLKVYRPFSRGTVLSYKHGGEANMIRLRSGPDVSFKIHGEEVNTNYRLNGSSWLHLALTWSANDGRWHMYINAGEFHLWGRAKEAQKVIPGGGELVLGQASRTPQTENDFDPKEAFMGEMGFVNIWHRVMSQYEIEGLVGDCTFTNCGDAIEWADFRSGTRGLVRLRWPSYILGSQTCFSEQEAGITCDKYCSHVIGAQCNAEIVENVEWARTPADQTARVACPGRAFSVNETIVYANRTCTRTVSNDGIWEDPVMDDCVSQKELDMKKTIDEFVSKELVNASQVLELASDLMNQTANEHYRNPVDIATIIDSISMLIQAQNRAMHDVTPMNRSGGPQRYTRRQQPYPLVGETQRFAETLAAVLDSLVTERNLAAWSATKPPGSEGDALVRVLEDLLGFLFRSLEHNVISGALSADRATVSAFRGRLAFRTKLYRSDSFPGLQFPATTDAQSKRRRRAVVAIDKDAILNLNDTDLPDIIGISTAIFSAAKTLPNHDLARKSKEDNVNTPLFSILFHFEENIEDERIRNLSRPIILRLPYVNTFNISNPECVRLVHSNSSAEERHGESSSTRVYSREPESLLAAFREQALAFSRLREHSSVPGQNGHDVTWYWARDGCQFVRGTAHYAVCECHRSGVFAVTTDMYDVNWQKEEEPNILMQVPSYIGCALSALLCLTSCVMLIYLRTSSKTAAIHKNFAVAIICSQITFMSGIDKFEFKVMCQVFAITFHYFFLATFSWLMNEAFNLYIVITYAAHAHGEHHESSSQWRYYILGWILPGILVGAFVGTHTDDYYAPDMCWIAWHYIWLFLGPAIGIISVTVLVLIFTAKEHHESSYSKNEQTNKMILIHSKALWTQTILLTVCWAFAFLTLKMRGVIIKYLYALFNILQGAFFLVFYFLLNDEVRAVLRARRKRKNMAKHGYEYSHTPSVDSNASVNEMIERVSMKDLQVEMSGPSSPGSGSVKQKKTNGINNKKKKQKSQIEASSDEGSDCEIMITSV